ncbi:MAG TPA: BON domain-containing protein [Gammaproteobacteria bacterium]
MKRNLTALILTTAVLALQGCVIVVDRGTEDGAYWGGEDYSVNGVEHDGDDLSRDVARLIADDVNLSSEDIRVTSEDGMVVLKGRVSDVYRLARALATAKSVQGVDRVVSEITVDAG